MTKTTRETIALVEAAGYDVVLVETVGVGQSETAVANMVDVFVVVAIPGAGDELQGIKRGLLELADIIAVNKTDGDGEGPARGAARELAGAMRMMMPGPATRRPPVLTCSALTGTGLDEVWSAVLEHREHLEAEGSLEVRRARQQQDWMWAMVDAQLHDAVRDARSVVAQRGEIERAVRAGELSAVDGTARILQLYVGDLRTSTEG